MKLRCVHNSIRLRVRKSDLKQLTETGRVEETLTFPDNTTFSFALAVDAKLKRTVATYENQQITVYLPSMVAQLWILTAQVGIEVTPDESKGETLHILLEKDFPCLDRENEDKSDTFFELADKDNDTC
jgi:hypothetical protein